MYTSVHTKVPMKTSINKLGAVLTGLGGAFALFPTTQLSQFVKQPSIAARINGNFARVGDNLLQAMGRVTDEQKSSAKPQRKAG